MLTDSDVKKMQEKELTARLIPGKTVKQIASLSAPTRKCLQSSHVMALQGAMSLVGGLIHKNKIFTTQDSIDTIKVSHPLLFAIYESNYAAAKEILDCGPDMDLATIENDIQDSNKEKSKAVWVNGENALDLAIRMLRWTRKQRIQLIEPLLESIREKEQATWKATDWRRQPDCRPKTCRGPVCKEPGGDPGHSKDACKFERKVWAIKKQIIAFKKQEEEHVKLIMTLLLSQSSNLLTGALEFDVKEFEELFEQIKKLHKICQDEEMAKIHKLAEVWVWNTIGNFCTLDFFAFKEEIETDMYSQKTMSTILNKSFDHRLVDLLCSDQSFIDRKFTTPTYSTSAFCVFIDYFDINTFLKYMLKLAATPREEATHVVVRDMGPYTSPLILSQEYGSFRGVNDDASLSTPRNQGVKY